MGKECSMDGEKRSDYGILVESQKGRDQQEDQDGRG
jgi:hypothetical protein